MSIIKLPHKLSVCEQCGPHVICGYCGNNCCNGSSGRQIKGADCDCTEAYEQQEQFYIDQATKAGFIFMDGLFNPISSFYMGVIPPNITTPNELFKAIVVSLQLPGYFVHNWNALSECISDLRWIAHKKIVLAHCDLPNLPHNELKTYLDILKEALLLWPLKNEQELIVTFPVTTREIVMSIVKEKVPCPTT